MSGNGAGPAKRKPSGGILKNKLFLFIFMPLMIIISAVIIFFIVKAIADGASVPASGSEKYVYVLPMSERPADAGGKTGKNPFRATGLSPVILTGVMYNPEGSSYAVLQSANKSYVLSSGQKIGDTGWTLTSISGDGVIVSKDDINESLTLQSQDIGGIETVPAE